jgi:peptidoglycan/xylan/chitin deacetylase (PgdA/CDA1 family)
MHHELYDHSPIVDRPELMWPGKARVAFYVGLNIEHFHVDKPSTSIVDTTTHLVPDALNYGWRDYGSRVGIWRVIDILDRHGIPASALLNSEVADHYPEIIEAGKRRNWAWLAHGETNSAVHAEMDLETERATLTKIVDRIAGATGVRPRGWMGPALTETFNTSELMPDLGLTYTLDWTHDDQPFWFRNQQVMSVPYSLELNDVVHFTMKGGSAGNFELMVRDQLDQLIEDEPGGRVMALALHPFVIGQPFRARYLDKALEYVANHPDVWVTTSDEIATHFATQQPPLAPPV